ncbi:MAG: cadmium-translocating P-type ATPase [Treponema sp.]|jgi:Cd2+/Zn2+-exporting ATPase|nr:cadmium-translocating P-type ATPase [Treponema sp.]
MEALMQKETVTEGGCCSRCAPGRERGAAGETARGGTAAGGLFREVLLKRAALILGILLFALGLFLKNAVDEAFALRFPGVPAPSLMALLGSYFFAGGEVLLQVLKNIARGKVFDENFLMSLATAGAFAIGEYPEAAAVMIFYQVGEAFQELAVNRSKRNIAALMDIRPDFANLKTGDGIRVVAPDRVAVGDRIIIRPGERVPLDGRVLEGSSTLDTSALTGEALPRDVERDSEVLSGSINKSGLLMVEVTRVFGESTVSKILNLVQSAGNRKARVENFISRFARYYTPAVVAAAAALAVLPPLITGTPFRESLYRALVFLVVSCPCALVISIPLSFFGGIGGASRKGILVKGGNFLEALNRVDTVVFDKTGTLTRGVFRVTRIVPAEGYTEEELLRLGARAEHFSTHPIAASIRDAWTGTVDPSLIEKAEEIAGCGVRLRMEGKTVLAGNRRLMEREGVKRMPRHEDLPGTIVYLALDGVLAGYFVIADELKEDSAGTIRSLRDLNIHSVMCTGDSRAAGMAAAAEAGVEKVYTELLPQDKVTLLEELEREKRGTGTIAFVGDGINDAPVLARSGIGIAMGGIGSDAAIEAADVVLMTDEPSKLITAIKIAKKTRAIIWQNIIFALGVKALILLLGALGLATIWEAIFGDVGVTLLAVFNSMRAMRTGGA